MKTLLAFVTEKPDLSIVEAVGGCAGFGRARGDHATIAAENNRAMKRDLGVTVEPDRASDSATRQNQGSNRRAVGNRKQRRIIPAMRVQVERRESDRVLTTVVVDSKVDQAVLPRLVDKRHDKRRLQLAITAITGNEVFSVNSKYDFPNEKANLAFGFHDAGEDGGAMFVVIAGEQVVGELIVVALRDDENPRLG